MADPVTPTTPLSGVIASLLPRAKVVLSPFPFGLSDDDNLRVVTVNAAAGVSLEVHYRLLAKDGSVKPGLFKQVPTSNRTATSTDFAMAGGFVTNITVVATAGTPKIGQTFVIVQIIRGVGATAIVLGTMLQGYVTTTQSLGWPGSAVVSSTEGEPCVRTIIGTATGGADATETVPTGARWELLSVRALATNSAAGIATPVRCRLDDGSNIYSEVYTPNYGGVSTVNPVCFGENGPTGSAAITGGVAVFGTLPINRMLAGHRFTLHSDSGGNTWAAPVYTVREWQEVG